MWPIRENMTSVDIYKESDADTAETKSVGCGIEKIKHWECIASENTAPSFAKQTADKCGRLKWKLLTYQKTKSVNCKVGGYKIEFLFED